MSIIGIIGTSEADATIITDGLANLRDGAADAGDPFWAILGLTPTSPEAMTTVIDWLIEEQIAYDIVVHPDVAAQLPAEWTEAADKTTKIKGVDNKVVDRLLAEEGTHLLVLLADEDPTSVEAVCQKAHEGGLVVMDLADALTEFSFEEPDTETTGEEEEAADEIDFAALGAAGDESDDTAIETLVGIAAGMGVDDTQYDTWGELAEALAAMVAEIKDAEAEKPAAAKKAASPKGKAAPAMWTQEALDGLDIKQVKAIATASGIAGAGKMGYAALCEKLLGTPMPTTEEAAAEEAPAKAPRAPKGEPLAEALGSDDVDLNDIIALGKLFLTRLGGYLANKS